MVYYCIDFLYNGLLTLHANVKVRYVCNSIVLIGQHNAVPATPFPLSQMSSLEISINSTQVIRLHIHTQAVWLCPIAFTDYQFHVTFPLSIVSA